MANNFDYVNSEYIKEHCDKTCSQISICFRILDFLKEKNSKEALKILIENDNNE